ncbi:TetR/AcrR family transcriptional regulator [Mangrovibacillus cuniculi]|uniref:TetR/AcrR family transcriptional regulator n=1 Tax=Mangrovibacillus cuniculi TaxID=2593652 RepID=A0A7S8HEH7_9BACI|nr:TetR/AcrR family transcriptional regulator [Mangrovibacillus cuniculi]QPC45844.1 TetR/AcrR family transcriptional regulator [Mangrovibacillus cuniculi]
MDGYERRTRLKQKKILDTAFALFSEKGIQKVKIQDIAAAAEVSQVTIYNYFSSKETLVVETIKHYLDQQLTAFDAILQSELPYEEKWNALFQMKIEQTSKLSPDFTRELLSENEAAVALLMDYSKNVVIPAFLSFIDTGKEVGYISTSISNQTILFVLDSLTQNVGQASSGLQSQEDVEKFTKEMNQFFFYGIRGR